MISTMKRLALSLLTLFAVAISWADSALFVHQKSGGVVEFAFSERPVVTYNEGNLIISVANASVTYPLEDMQKFTFGEVDDDVTRIVAPESVTPQPTYIYSVDGKLMRTLEPGKDGRTPASVVGLPAGTYIVKNGKTSYKIQKK